MPSFSPTSESHLDTCDMRMKICSVCGDEKEISLFGYSRPNVHRANCKVCQNEYNRQWRSENPDKAKKYIAGQVKYHKAYRMENREKRNERLKKWGRENPGKKRAQKYRHRYGIDIKDYEDLLLSQESCCAICKSKDKGRKGAKYFVIDHCHDSGKVRGLLCHKCNVILGYAEDGIDRLQSAIEYLKRSS